MTIYIESRVCEELKIPYDEKTKDDKGHDIPRQTWEIKKADLIEAWKTHVRDSYYISTLGPTDESTHRIKFKDFITLQTSETLTLINKGHGYFLVK